MAGARVGALRGHGRQDRGQAQRDGQDLGVHGVIGSSPAQGLVGVRR